MRGAEIKSRKNTKKKSTSQRKKKEKSGLPGDTPVPGGKPEPGFPIIGLGASAGGLEAMEKFFSNMPAGSGMAFVVIQHLDPKHESITHDLLKRHTTMSICQATDNLKIEPDSIYVIPPNWFLGILHGRLHLLEPVEPHGLRMPVDYFFRSLAEDRTERAIGIILSGTGSDGTLGVKAIKGVGGMIMAQEEQSAKFDGMPHSVIETGLADFILPPERMGEQLVRYMKSLNMEYRVKPELITQKSMPALQKIYIILRTITGHDLSLYKQNTIYRRVYRRMAVHQIEDMSEYALYLQQNAAEVRLLFKELLIGVTNFFRDPEAFELLKSTVLPSLIDSRAHNQPLRIWVPACSTGEEAYSIAILIQECIAHSKKDFPVQIFATDIDETSIDIARAGLYTAGIAADVSPERLSRYFSRDGNSFRIKKSVRESIVFATQDIIKDPPFSRMDLISCRNMLIYMGGDLQKRILLLFHYSLTDSGILFLGNSESIGEFADLFSTINRTWKMYKRKGAPSYFRQLKEMQVVEDHRDASDKAAGKKIQSVKPDFREIAFRLILEHYSPPCVIINEAGDIFFIQGRTGMFLEPAAGEASLNIVKMAREGLRVEISSAIRNAAGRKREVIVRSIRIKTNGSAIHEFDLMVKPITRQETMQGMLLVVFAGLKTLPSRKKAGSIPEGGRRELLRVRELEQELGSTREHLQSTIEELETSNEELKSTNEELQSANEEMQSTNEELETSREELQSVNEELVTVNTELQTRIDQLSQVSSDMNNLMAGTEIAVIFLDNELKIKRFTPPVTRIINLIASDIGRPLGHIAMNILDEDILRSMGDVLDTLAFREKEVRLKDGTWYFMRIIPYRTIDNVINGVVITFVDISLQKKAEKTLRDSYDFVENILETVREPLLVLDSALTVISANRSFYTTFKTAVDETIGRTLPSLGNGQWDIPILSESLRKVFERHTAFNDLRVEHNFESIGPRVMLLNARELNQSDTDKNLVLLAIEDITGIERESVDEKP